MTMFKVMTYNLLYYRKTTPDFVEGDPQRSSDILNVIKGQDPEVLAVQEVVDTAGAMKLKEELKSKNGVDYNLAFDEMVTGVRNGQDVGLLWKKSALFEEEPEQVKIIESAQSTGNRNILQVTLKARQGGELWHFFVAHLQSKSGKEFRNERKKEIELLRDLALDRLMADGSKCIVLGDLNLYNHKEPAYQSLLDAGLKDPPLKEDSTLQLWTGKRSQYATLYTQSTRASGFGGGGLDDRFDFILPSPSVKTVTGSYKVIGNGNGSDFDVEVSDETLRNASDHLPVVVEFCTENHRSIRFHQVVSNPPGIDAAGTEWFSLRNHSNEIVDLVDAKIEVRKTGITKASYFLSTSIAARASVAFVFPDSNVLPNSGSVDLVLTHEGTEVDRASYEGGSPSTSPVVLSRAM